MLKDLLILAGKASEIRGYGGCLYFDFPKQETQVTLFISRKDKILLEIKIGKNYTNGVYMQRHVDLKDLKYIRNFISSLRLAEDILKKY